jgi:hypothetical protein
MHGSFKTKHHSLRGGAVTSPAPREEVPVSAIATASYILLLPHYLASGYAPAGTVVVEG